MQFHEGPLALYASAGWQHRRRFSARVAVLTIGLLSGALWAGLIWLVSQGL